MIYEVNANMFHVHVLFGLAFLVASVFTSHHEATKNNFETETLGSKLHSASSPIAPASTVEATSQNKLTISNDSHLGNKDSIDSFGSSTEDSVTSSITTHNIEKTISNYPRPFEIDKEGNSIDVFGNEQQACLLVKERYQTNATLDRVPCAIPKNFRLIELGLASYCNVSLIKFKVIAFIIQRCDSLSTSVIEQLEDNYQKGLFVSVNNGSISPVRLVCLSPKKVIGNVANRYICPLNDESIQVSDRVRLFDYLKKVCNYPAHVVNKNHISIVGTVDECTHLDRITDMDFSEQHHTSGYDKETLKICIGFGSMGILLNLAGIVILAKGGIAHTKRSRTPSYFVTMLVMDTFDLLGLKITMLVWLGILQPLQGGLCHMTFAVRVAGTMVSTFSLLAITIERYFAVCHPMKVNILLPRSVQNKVRISCIFHVNYNPFMQ